MGTSRCALHVLSSVMALLISSWFVFMYSHFSYVRFTLEDTPEKDLLLTPASLALYEYKYMVWAVPFSVLALGIALVLRRAEGAVLVLSHVAWLLAMFLICFAIVAWEAVFIPLIRLR